MTLKSPINSKLMITALTKCCSTLWHTKINGNAAYIDRIFHSCL